MSAGPGKKTSDKVFKFFASLKLAVIILLSLSVLIAAGTIVESRFDANIAGKLVYKTPWMFGVMGMLAINLAAVMIDRWPWKRRHVPFLLAHIGIIILLIGSYFTMNWGLDGSMRIGIGEKARYVQVPISDLTIYSSFDGSSYTKLFDRQVDFFRNSPEKTPLTIPLDNDQLQITNYMPFAIPTKKIVPSTNEKLGSAVRFQIQNDRMNTGEWLVQNRPNEEVSQVLGLAEFRMGKIPESNLNANVLYFEPLDQKKVKYAIFNKDPKKKPKRGVLEEGGKIQTDWMGFEVQLLRYLPKAEDTWDFKKVEYPNASTVEAVQITYQGRSHWVMLNDVLKIFSEKAVYLITYAHRRIDLGFDLTLKKFEVGRYQGTMRAASYQSLVVTPQGKEELISMNEPLKYQGLTFYQASFQDGPDGKPLASILSVNHDPGRWLKYLGSLLISLGTIVLFYDKRKAARALGPKANQEVLL